MSTSTSLSNEQTSDAIVSVVTVHLDTAHSTTILQQIIESLRSEYGSLAGFISAEVLLSLDEKTVAIVSEWDDVRAWGASRYDPRVGELLETCLDNSTALAFEIYYRQSYFAGDAHRIPVTQVVERP